MSYFLVYSKLPKLTEEMMMKIPQHRAKIDKYLQMGKVVSYAVAADRSALWMTVFAADETAVMDLLSKLPLVEFLNPEITPLMFQLSPDLVQSVSWN
ncbi:MAG: hypothetical protein EP332_08090 [Bacteroidetes bacterium]|nr:MAG: hypothetical protein EP332_08090 [Bacteroidota bacterium]